MGGDKVQVIKASLDCESTPKEIARICSNILLLIIIIIKFILIFMMIFININHPNDHHHFHACRRKMPKYAGTSSNGILQHFARSMIGEQNRQRQTFLKNAKKNEKKAKKVKGLFHILHH